MGMSGDETLLDRYELRGVLGCGGMAEVRDGWDQQAQPCCRGQIATPGTQRPIRH